MEEKKRQILIIDDDENIGYTLKKQLERSNKYEVSHVLRGRAGIKAAARNKPDLIILDLMMPGMDGFEVLKRLKAKSSTVLIPVIILTGQNDEEYVTETMQSYAEQYVNKPVDFKLLESKVDSILSLRKKSAVSPSESP